VSIINHELCVHFVSLILSCEIMMGSSFNPLTIDCNLISIVRLTLQMLLNLTINILLWLKEVNNEEGDPPQIDMKFDQLAKSSKKIELKCKKGQRGYRLTC
jgi:hypothetical protein